jgi:hypothetical protein
VVRLGLPLLPKQDTEIWTVQARLQFEGRRKPAKATLLIPSRPADYVVLEEDFISGNFGLAIEDDRPRRVSWAIRRANGSQTLYYRLSLARGAAAAVSATAPPFPSPPDFPEPFGSASQALLQDVREESADVDTFTRELLSLLNNPTPDENVKLIRQGIDRPSDWAKRITEILHGARIPSHVVEGLRLGQSRNEAQLEPWVAVHNGRKWRYYDPASGRRGLPDDFLIWHESSEPLASVEGAKGNPQVVISVARTYREIVQVARKRAGEQGSRIIEFSLLTLPINVQNVYRVLVMLPLGALLLVFLRNVIGLKTFGTFMPILIGLAFRETQLLWGIVLFATLVGLGLFMRFYLERLRLLLVPRLAAVLTIVVMLMAAVSILSQQLGLQRSLSVALFPMVILAMTIERMSVVWEEHGPGEAMLQGAGSLVVASLGYLVMTDHLLTHLMFVFPELLLVVLAITLLLGRYTGYRLSELWRFRHAVQIQPPEPPQ